MTVSIYRNNPNITTSAIMATMPDNNINGIAGIIGVSKDSRGRRSLMAKPAKLAAAAKNTAQVTIKG